MAKTLDEFMRERPGRPEVQVEHIARMMAAVRRQQLRDFRKMWRMKPIDPPQR